MVGVWPAVMGKVRLDGADIFRWNKGELGPHVGYLPQDIELFAGTIAENIARFGSVESERVIAAARCAGLHEMILRFPTGYDTPIGEGGNMLSGGQRQRIALARAVHGDPAERRRLQRRLKSRSHARDARHARHARSFLHPW